ncbi:MAG: response regulator [Agriterribacter sp.]
MTGKPIQTLALVDDHTLFRKGMINLIATVNSDYKILFEADNGVDLQKKISLNNQPDILLMDINMPHMDGFATVQWMRDNYPLVSILVVSMIQQEESIVRMLKLGVKGYVCKDIEPRELGEALHSIANKGFYYTDFITGKLVHSLQAAETDTFKSTMLPLMNERERDFLKLACSEYTYNEIASQMYVSPKTVDGYRNSLFEKLNVKSRVGLALYAVKHGLVQL